MRPQVKISLTVDQVSKHPQPEGEAPGFALLSTTFLLDTSLLSSYFTQGYPAKYQLILEEVCLTKFFPCGSDNRICWSNSSVSLSYPHMIFLIGAVQPLCCVGSRPYLSSNTPFSSSFVSVCVQSSSARALVSRTVSTGGEEKIIKFLFYLCFINDYTVSVLWY